MPKNSNIKEYYVEVDKEHKLYCREAGNKEGIDVIFVHGGPGGQTLDSNFDFFNLEKFRVILFDQRGCGKSIPRYSLKNNETKYLIEDIEKIRNFFKIDKFILFGGSWGSCLSLLYAQKYPKNVLGMVLRGIFLGEKEEWEWIYQKGASFFYPREFSNFANYANDKNDIINSYYEMLHSNDFIKRERASFLWANWENLLAYTKPKKDCFDKEFNYQIALIENWYAKHNTFLKQENQILNNTDSIKNIKTYIVHGRYDLICRPEKAYLLHKNLNNSELHFCQNSSHSINEIEIKKQLIECVNKFLMYYQ